MKHSFLKERVLLEIQVELSEMSFPSSTSWELLSLNEDNVTPRSAALPVWRGGFAAVVAMFVVSADGSMTERIGTVAANGLWS